MRNSPRGFLTSLIEGGSDTMRPGFLLQFTYHLDLKEALKRAIPHVGAHGVNYDSRPDTTTRGVSEDYRPVLGRLMTNFEALLLQQPRLL